jgi:DNA-binding FadR family transcriptional regulator
VIPKVDLIRRYVIDGLSNGALRAGARLPAERELAQRFGLTRAAVRQALTVLEAERRVTRQVGRGTFVGRAPAASEARPAGEVNALGNLSPAEILQARLLFEPHIVELVVVNANEGDLQQIEQILTLQSRLADGGEFEVSDTHFHDALAQATHNDLVVATSGLIARARQGPEWVNLKRSVAQRHGGARPSAHHEHREIFDAVRARDAFTAGRAMRNHLERVRQHLLGY